MSQTTKGGLSLFFSAFLFSIFGVFTRVLSTEASILSQLIIRSIMMIVAFLCIVAFTKTNKKVKKQHMPIFILRGIAIVLNLYFFIQAVNVLPIGLTMFIFFASSLVTNFFIGYVFFKESITKIKLISLLASVAGMILVYQDSIATFALAPMVFAGVSGAFFGISGSTSKFVNPHYHIFYISLVEYCIALLGSIVLIGLLTETVSFQYSSSIYLTFAAYSGVSVFALFSLLYGFKYVESQIGGLILLSEIVFALFVGYIVYGETITTFALLGGGLILAGASIPNLVSLKSGQQT